MAFAADPDTEAPTVAKSFSTVSYTGTGSSQSIDGLGFQPNLVWIKSRTQGLYHFLIDSVRGAGLANSLSSNTTDGESFATEVVVNSLDSDGFTINADDGTGYYGWNMSNQDYVAWAWKADDNEPTIFGGPAVAVYKFEDNANDVTGNYNATATNVTYSSSGKFNKAASFNGSSSKLDTGYTFANTTFSVSFWFKTTDTSKILITNTSDTTPASNNDGFRIYTDKVVLTQDDVDVVTRNFSSSLGDGNWHNVVVTNDGSTLTVYIDGSAAHTNSSTGFTQNNSYPVVMGYQPRSTINQYLNGLIDQVRFYNGAIKQEQVDELYAETASDNDDTLLGGPPETIISANANAGFSIVKYTGTGSDISVPHGLGQKPDFVVIKQTTSASAWVVFSDATGTFSYSYLNTTAAFNAYPAMSWDSSVINLNGGTDQNRLGDTHIAYFFTSISGYSDIGSYAGNASLNTITTGFQPDFILLHNTTLNTEYWITQDSVRGVDNALFPNASDAEYNNTNINLTFTSTGFTLNNTFDGWNDTGFTYIYMAFKIN